MAEPMKPKRGFVWAPGLEEAIRDGHAFTVNLTPTKAATLPVLVIPDPDREPTPEEIEALAQQMYAHTLPTATLEFGAVRPWEQANDGFRRVWRSIAAQAFRLGARVPS